VAKEALRSTPGRAFLVDQWSSASSYSNENIFFQSFFMLMTDQPFFFASS
jgi:hypothetical protein